MRLESCNVATTTNNVVEGDVNDIRVIGIEVNMNSLNFYDFDGACFRNLLKVSTISLSFFGVPKVTSACLRKPFEALLARGDFRKDSLRP